MISGSVLLWIAVLAVLLDVEAAMESLGEITGRTVREDITNRIFERFQLGTPNQMTIRKAVKKSMEGRQDVPNRSTPGQMPTNEFIERLFSKKRGRC